MSKNGKRKKTLTSSELPGRGTLTTRDIIQVVVSLARHCRSRDVLTEHLALEFLVFHRTRELHVVCLFLLDSQGKREGHTSDGCTYGLQTHQAPDAKRRKSGTEPRRHLQNIVRRCRKVWFSPRPRERRQPAPQAASAMRPAPPLPPSSSVPYPSLPRVLSFVFQQPPQKFCRGFARSRCSTRCDLTSVRAMRSGRSEIALDLAGPWNMLP